MLRKSNFINSNSADLFEWLDFSPGLVKKIKYDYKSGQLICRNQGAPRKSSFCFDPLRCDFKDIVKCYDGFVPKPEKYDVCANKLRLDNIAFILKQSALQREKECSEFVSGVKYFPDISSYLKSLEHNRLTALQNRIKRFSEKAYWNRKKYQWFVTITRDDRLFDSEEKWFYALKKCFSNLADRYGLRYQGVFERGDLGKRLHFHCFLHVPEDCPVSFFFFKEYRESVKDHQIHLITDCDYFRSRFGMTEWDYISQSSDQDYKSNFQYMTKYTTKDSVTFFYSRYLPNGTAKYLSFKDVFFKEEFFNSRWFVCSDDVLYENSSSESDHPSFSQLSLFG